MSDGTVTACGNNNSGECDLPAVHGEASYIQIAAGVAHTVLLRSDGTAVACGRNDAGQCDLPALDDGLTYTQVAAGGSHTLLLRSDGTVVACGNNYAGECDIPAACAGLTYTHVAAGFGHSVLIRSDGAAVAFGSNDAGQCQLPSLQRWAGCLCSKSRCVRFKACQSLPSLLPTLVLQAAFDGSSIHFITLAGEEFCQMRAALTDCLSEIHANLMLGHFAGLIGSRFRKVDVVLPGGELLDRVSTEGTRAYLFF
jgi:alpha-tubulin suppressor-like RCC1 family protein